MSMNDEEEPEFVKEPDETPELDFENLPEPPVLSREDVPEEPPMELYFREQSAKSIEAAQIERELAAKRRREKIPNSSLGAIVVQNIRAQEKKIPGKLEQAEWDLWAQCFRGCCAYCGAKEKKLVIEHVLPLHHGGRNDIYNVVPACAHCNMSKGPKRPIYWLERTGRLDRFLANVLPAIKRMERKAPTA